MTIVALTLREAANRRVLTVGAIISVAFIGLFWLGFAVGFSRIAADTTGDPFEQTAAATVMTVLGLYAVQFLAAFLSVLLSSGAIASEIDSGRLHALLARPISRTSWLAQRAGTYAGLAVVYVAVMSTAVLLISGGIAGYGPLDPVRAVALLAMEVLVLVALGTVLSTRLSSIAAGVVVIALYGAAWIAGIMELVGGLLDNAGLERIGVAVSLVVPSDALWRGASFYLQSPAFLAAAGADGGIPFAGTAAPSPAFLAWSVAYVVVASLVARRWFTRRDL